MKRVVLVIIFVFSVTVSELLSVSINDSCFYLIGIDPIPGYEIHNPDSILVDTCSCSGIPWIKCPELYAKEWYLAIFPFGVFDLPKYPSDTTIFVTIEDMDTSFTEIKQKFIDLETNFSGFTIKKVAPNIIDSSITARSFLISFNEYCKIESVIDSMQIDNDYWHFSYNFRLLLYQLSGKNDTPKIYKEDIGIYPIPASNIINIVFSSELNNICIDLFSFSGILLDTYYFRSNQTISLNLTHYRNGLYFLKINEIIKPFIINR